jgi:glycosyltransferase involved in cell wall biosynthesis
MTWDLAGALRQLAWDVTVLTSPVAGRPREFTMGGLHVVTVPSAWPERGDKAWEQGAQRLARRLGLDSFDAVLGLGPAGHVLRPRGPASVFHCRDTLLDDGLRSTLPWWGTWSLTRVAREMDYLRRADAIVVPDARIAAGLRRRPYAWVARARRPLVVRSGVPTRRFHPDAEAGAEWRRLAGIPGGAPLVVTVSRLEPGKGVATALGAFRAFRREHPDARMAVIGTGPLHAEVRKRAMDLNLGRSVLLAGRVPDAHVVRWLQAADLFLFLPTRCSPRPPLNVAEALACGVPVVTTAAAVDPGSPHPLLHPVAAGRAGEAALALGRLWSRPRRRRRAPAFPEEWRIEACARRHDGVLRGRRA